MADLVERRNIIQIGANDEVGTAPENSSQGEGNAKFHHAHAFAENAVDARKT